MGTLRGGGTLDGVGDLVVEVGLGLVWGWELGVWVGVGVGNLGLMPLMTLRLELGDLGIGGEVEVGVGPLGLTRLRL